MTTGLGASTLTARGLEVSALGAAAGARAKSAFAQAVISALGRTRPLSSGARAGTKALRPSACWRLMHSMRTLAAPLVRAVCSPFQNFNAPLEAR